MDNLFPIEGCEHPVQAPNKKSNWRTVAPITRQPDVVVRA